MMTYEEILNGSRAALNDQDGEVFTNGFLLAYLNMALSELQEIFELNSIPVTQKTSTVIDVPSGNTEVTFAPTPPIVGVDYLPSDLVEINQLWESADGQNKWVPVTKKDYLTRDILPGAATLNCFGVWAWQDQAIQLLACIQDRDLKLDYIKSLFLTLVLGDLDEDNTILNTDLFLQFRTAGLAAEFVDENDARAAKNNNYAAISLERSLGISTKGKQSIIYRRRPFRTSFKRRGVLI